MNRILLDYAEQRARGGDRTAHIGAPMAVRVPCAVALAIAEEAGLTTLQERVLIKVAPVDNGYVVLMAGDVELAAMPTQQWVDAYHRRVAKELAEEQAAL